MKNCAAGEYVAITQECTQLLRSTRRSNFEKVLSFRSQLKSRWLTGSSGSLAHLAHWLIWLMRSLRGLKSLTRFVPQANTWLGHRQDVRISKNHRRRRNGPCLSYVGVEFQRNLSTLIFHVASAQVGVAR